MDASVFRTATSGGAVPSEPVIQRHDANGIIIVRAAFIYFIGYWLWTKADFLTLTSGILSGLVLLLNTRAAALLSLPKIIPQTLFIAIGLCSSLAWWYEIEYSTLLSLVFVGFSCWNLVRFLTTPRHSYKMRRSSRERETDDHEEDIDEDFD